MFDISKACTAISRDVLTRLIAAARVTEAVTWAEAEREAEQEVTSLWGAPAGPLSFVEVSTGVLIQLAAAATAAVRSEFASGSDWAPLVRHDLTKVHDLAAPAGSG